MNDAEIRSQLQKFRHASDELEISETEREKLFSQAATYLNAFIGLLQNEKGYQQKEVASLTISDTPTDFKELLSVYQKEVVENGINAASGKHLGYIPGGGIFASALADLIAAVTNPYAGVYFASPGAATLETEVIHWLKKIFSFPQTAVGSLSSGGSISTLTALTAARDAHEIKSEKIYKTVMYVSSQVHHSTQKALRILGLEDAFLRVIPTDDNHRMQAEVLEEIILQDVHAGLYPFLVVASAGTTDTGAVDPLNKIADIAEKYKLWFHVDAAYGGFFILTSKKHLFAGIERADSLIIDPHKSMFLPYGIGAVLVKDKHAVLHSHHRSANYMQDTTLKDLTQSSANLSPELSKHFRGLRIWLPLQLHGIQPFVACLEEKLLLVQYFRNKLLELGFCVGPEPDLSVSYFWYPFSSNTDEKNKQLLQRIHADGTVFLSSSIINNRFVIRIAILSFRTKIETIDEAVEMLARCLQEVNQTA